MKAELVPDNGDPPIPITRDVTVVGRREYCDVVIEHSSLSKRHCVLVKTDGLLVVRDLASTNGTKVKGQRVRWAALLPDDRLTLGSYKFRVYLGPDGAPGPSERVDARKKELRARPKPVVPPAAAARRPSASGFAAPSPLGTPAVQVSESWPGGGEPEPESGDVSSWWDRLKSEPEAPDSEDVVIELD